MHGPALECTALPYMDMPRPNLSSIIKASTVFLLLLFLTHFLIILRIIHNCSALIAAACCCCCCFNRRRRRGRIKVSSCQTRCRNCCWTRLSSQGYFTRYAKMAIFAQFCHVRTFLSSPREKSPSSLFSRTKRDGYKQTIRSLRI